MNILEGFTPSPVSRYISSRNTNRHDEEINLFLFFLQSSTVLCEKLEVTVQLYSLNYESALKLFYRT